MQVAFKLSIPEFSTDKCMQEPAVAGTSEVQHSELFDEMIDGVAGAAACLQITSLFHFQL